MKKPNLPLSLAAILMLLFAVSSFAAEAPDAELLSTQQAAPSQLVEPSDSEEIEHPWTLDPLLHQPTLSFLGQAQCNDYCYDQGVLCLSGCAPGDDACEMACARAEMCCNCDCGAIPPGACSSLGC